MKVSAALGNPFIAAVVSVFKPDSSENLFLIVILSACLPWLVVEGQIKKNCSE